MKRKYIAILTGVFVGMSVLGGCGTTSTTTTAVSSTEAVCIEGLNSLHLFDTDLTGNMSDDEQNDCTWNVILDVEKK